ncbi:MAG: hypothetical protein LWY06_17930 [Firmicutes bacterium]|nr:hypothetical protein [Bacillota bacterium]
MEVRNNTRFLIFTLILIALMGVVIYMFREHPMGADFSQFKMLNHQDLANPGENFGKRVVVRGRVTPAAPGKYVDFANQKNVLGYIEAKTDPTAGNNAKPSYVRFGAVDFFIQVDASRILVVGQPEQIIDTRNRIYATSTPGQYVDMIREGNDYSIFGTIGKDNAGNYILIPYRVTFQEIQPVAKEAAELNRKMAFIQYLSIFAIVAAYVIALAKGGVFGPPEAEEGNGEKKETASSGSVDENSGKDSKGNKNQGDA